MNFTGYVVFTDRYYTRPQLCHILAQRRTWLTGTVMQNAKHMPKQFSQLYVKEIQNATTGEVLRLATC